MVRFQISRVVKLSRQGTQERNESGFSLIEMLLVVALIGITSMAILSLSENMNTQMTNARVKTDAESVVMGVQSVLKSDDSCRGTLNASAINPVSQQYLTRIAYYDSTATWIADVLPTTAWNATTGVPGNPRLSIVNIKLTKPGDATQPPVNVGGSATIYAADVIVSMKQSGNAPSMKPYVIGGLQFQWDTVGLKVTNCKLGMSQLCVTGYDQAMSASSFNQGISSSDPGFSNVFADAFGVYETGSDWGLTCQAGWKMTGCAASALKPITSVTAMSPIANGCSASKAAVSGTSGASRVYLSCCSQ